MNPGVQRTRSEMTHEALILMLAIWRSEITVRKSLAVLVMTKIYTMSWPNSNIEDIDVDIHDTGIL